MAETKELNKAMKSGQMKVEWPVIVCNAKDCKKRFVEKSDYYKHAQGFPDSGKVNKDDFGKFLSVVSPHDEFTVESEWEYRDPDPVLFPVQNVKVQ